MYQGQRFYVWYLKSYISDVIPIFGSVHKKYKDSSLNHLSQMQTFASMRSTPFMEIDDKGERLYKDMKALEEIERLNMDMDKEGATLKNVNGSKFLDKKSTQVGGACS